MRNKIPVAASSTCVRALCEYNENVCFTIEIRTVSRLGAALFGSSFSRDFPCVCPVDPRAVDTTKQRRRAPIHKIDARRMLKKDFKVIMIASVILREGEESVRTWWRRNGRDRVRGSEEWRSNARRKNRIPSRRKCSLLLHVPRVSSLDSSESRNGVLYYLPTSKGLVFPMNGCVFLCEEEDKRRTTAHDNKNCTKVRSPPVNPPTLC